MAPLATLPAFVRHPAPIELAVANFTQNTRLAPHNSVLMSPLRAYPAPPPFYEPPLVVIPAGRTPSLSSTTTSDSVHTGSGSYPSTPIDTPVDATTHPISPALARKLLEAPCVRCVPLPPLVVDGSAFEKEGDVYDQERNAADARVRVEMWRHAAHKVAPGPLPTVKVRFQYES